MQSFGGQNFDDSISIRQIRRTFSPSKLCAIRYFQGSTYVQELHKNPQNFYHWKYVVLRYIEKLQYIEKATLILFDMAVKNNISNRAFDYNNTSIMEKVKSIPYNANCIVCGRKLWTSCWNLQENFTVVSFMQYLID